jgi:hypothetical protein
MSLSSTNLPSFPSGQNLLVVKCPYCPKLHFTFTDPSNHVWADGYIRVPCHACANVRLSQEHKQGGHRHVLTMEDLIQQWKLIGKTTEKRKAAMRAYSRKRSAARRRLGQASKP